VNPTERTASRRCEERERERERKGKRKKNERTHQIAMWDGNTEGGGREVEAEAEEEGKEC